MSSLKNPFGEKNGKLILISDISPKENGKKCGCICPLCKGDFQAKNNGTIRQPHFAHLGKPCNETIAFMTALYKFFEQSIELSGTFCPPSVYANFSGLAADQRAWLSTIRAYTNFSTVQLDKAEIILESHPFEVEGCEVVCKKELPEALLLTAKEKQRKLAVIVVPPATICKEQQAPQPYNQLPTLAIYIDKNVNFYELHSEQLMKKIEKLDFRTEWIKNNKLERLKDEWLERKLQEHQLEYEKIKERQKDVQKRLNEKIESVDQRRNVVGLTEERWHTCVRCHKCKPESELVYYQHDREDDEAICRECSQKKNREIEQSVVDVDIWNFEK